MANGLPIIQAADPHIGLKGFIQNFIGGRLQDFEQRQLAQQVGQLFPNLNLQGVTNPAALQVAAQLGLQQQAQQAELLQLLAKPKTPESESQFTAFLGRKIAEGTASEEEKTLFGQLTKVPEGTQIFMGEAGPGTVANQLEAFGRAQRQINDFTQNPENADLSKDFKAGVVTNPKGQLVLDIKAKDKPTAEQIKSREFLELLKAKVDRINVLAKEKSKIGPIQGRFAKAKGALIGGEPVATELNQLLDSLIMRVYMLSGKQINETELRFLQGIQPQVKDPDDTFDTKLQGFYNELKQLSGISDKLWNEAGIKTPTSIKPTKATNIPSPPIKGIAESDQNFQDDFSAWQQITQPEVWRKLPGSITNKIQRALAAQIRWSEIIEADDVKAALERK